MPVLFLSSLSSLPLSLLSGLDCLPYRPIKQLLPNVLPSLVLKATFFGACFSPPRKGLRRVRVLYEFQARNSKELSVSKGEEVAVGK